MTGPISPPAGNPPIAVTVFHDVNRVPVVAVDWADRTETRYRGADVTTAAALAARAGLVERRPGLDEIAAWGIRPDPTIARVDFSEGETRFALSDGRVLDSLDAVLATVPGYKALTDPDGNVIGLTSTDGSTPLERPAPDPFEERPALDALVALLFSARGPEPEIGLSRALLAALMESADRIKVQSPLGPHPISLPVKQLATFIDGLLAHVEEYARYNDQTPGGPE